MPDDSTGSPKRAGKKASKKGTSVPASDAPATAAQDTSEAAAKPAAAARGVTLNPRPIATTTVTNPVKVTTTVAEPVKPVVTGVQEPVKTVATPVPEPVITIPTGVTIVNPLPINKNPIDPNPVGGVVKPVTLTINVPVTTSTPSLQVAGFSQAGSYVVSLAVIDDLGVTSRPATLQFQVTPQEIIQ